MIYIASFVLDLVFPIARVIHTSGIGLFSYRISVKLYLLEYNCAELRKSQALKER